MANGSRLDGSEWHAGIPSWHSKPKSGEDTEMDSDTNWFKADPNKAWRRTGPRGRRRTRGEWALRLSFPFPWGAAAAERGARHRRGGRREAAVGLGA